MKIAVLKRKLRRKSNEIPLIDEPEKSPQFPWSSRLSILIESFLEKLAEERKPGRFGTNYMAITHSILLGMPFFFIFSSLIVAFFTSISKLDEFETALRNQITAMLMFTYLGGVTLLQSRKPYMSTRHFTDASPIPFILVLIAIAIYTLIVVHSVSNICNYVTLAGFCFCILPSIFLPILSAQRSIYLRFDPTEDNYKYAKVDSQIRFDGNLRIVESSISKITIQNVGTTPYNLENLNICRLSIDFWIPKYVLKPQRQLELVPETASFEGKCLRIPGIHCFGIWDRAPVVKTVLSFSCTGRGESYEHRPRRFLAELTEINELVGNKDDEEFFSSKVSDESIQNDH